ncbi:MAG: hypothetical protein CMK32_00275, partial [Porticoccaceae bacterium]|nr:hypothetical protein [Porticoccaceae bacterium]
MNNQIAPGLTVNEGESVSGFLLSSVGGELQSRSPDGNVTKLDVGAPLIEGHTLVSPQGGQFLVVMSDGTVRELPRSGEFLISGTLLEQLAVIDSDSGQYQQLLAGISSESGNGSEMASAATGGDTQPSLTEDARELLAQTGLDPDSPEFLELLAALQAGEDISEKLEAPAAGEGGNAPSSESIQNATQFVFLNPQVRPAAGIDPDLTFTPGPIPTADSSFAVETVDDSPTPPPDDDPTTPPDDDPTTPPDDDPTTP